MKMGIASKTSKGRFFFFCFFVIVILSIVYVYLMYTQEHYRNAKWAEKRCLSELASVKYQLKVVTDFKSDVEKMLTESQKAHTQAKEKFKEVAESCVTMKQQSLLCQSQFDDLQSECKKVREKYNKDKWDTTNLKIQLQLEKESNKILKHTINELYEDISRLSRSNAKHQNHFDSLENVKQKEDLHISYEEEKGKKVPSRSFARQVEASPGTYVIDTNKDSPPNFTAAENAIQKNNNERLKSQTKDKLSGVPPGFAPVLDVVDSGDNMNLQKPPNYVKTPLEMESVMKKHVVVAGIDKNGDRDLEVVAPLPEADRNADHGVRVEHDDGLAPAQAEQPRPAGPALPAAQEDDDEEEEYSA